MISKNCAITALCIFLNYRKFHVRNDSEAHPAWGQHTGSFAKNSFQIVSMNSGRTKNMLKFWLKIFKNFRHYQYFKYRVFFGNNEIIFYIFANVQNTVSDLLKDSNLPWGWSENILGQAVVSNTAGVGAQTAVPWHGNLEHCP